MEIMDKIDTYRLCNSLMIKPTTQSRVMGDSYDKSVLHVVVDFMAYILVDDTAKIYPRRLLDKKTIKEIRSACLETVRRECMEGDLIYAAGEIPEKSDTQD